MTLSSSPGICNIEIFLDIKQELRLTGIVPRKEAIAANQWLRWQAISCVTIEPNE